MKFGRNTGIDYPHAYELPSDGRIADLPAAAQREGINLLDTAPAYGTSEAHIGEAIEGHRDDWIICTKLRPARSSTASLRRLCHP